MNTRRATKALIAIVLPLCVPAARGEVRLPKLLGSHMVLQRDEPVHLWGWSDVGENVSAVLNGVTRSTTGDRFGRWSLYLPPQPAGGPIQITVTGQNKIVLEDLLMGDVWFASGQSNMEMPLSGFPGSAVVINAAQEISGANNSQMRLFLVRRKASDVPLADFDSERGWTACTPESAATFSAVAYFFGREIAAREHVAIGLIDSTWGGTPAEAWMSLNGLSSDASLMPVFAARAEMIDEEADAASVIELEKREDAAARSAHQPAPKHSWHPDQESWAPAGLFNAMVAPAVPYAIKGVIWYQGESNSGPARAPLYEKVFPALIADWRTHWQEGNFPFLFVQISSFKAGHSENWPAIREAQRRTLSIVNTGMAVTIDVGDPGNVHPSDKQSVGARLALAARALAYGEKIEYSGPLFRRVSTEDHSIRVWFDDASGGLSAKGGPLAGFEVAGDDRKFVSATASLDGGSVLVTSATVGRPKYVRYGWESVPNANLFNAAGLPASPFTSESEIPER